MSEIVQLNEEVIKGQIKDENGGQDAQSDPRPGEQGRLPEEGERGGRNAPGHTGAWAAKKIEDGVEETLTYTDFPSEHWTRIRTNNVLEQLNCEIRRRTRVVGCFPDGNSALMLACARLRHVAGTQWGNKKYMNMKHLETMEESTAIASWPHLPETAYQFCA